jgi:Mn2+/Fe2+ NRAMP family transporter
MNETMQSKSVLRKLIAVVLAFGPGIFAIGYTIGTGSVTSMVVAGSRFNMQLLWVLLLSCLFSGLLIYAYGNYSLVRSETALFGFRRHLPLGRTIAILIIVGVSFGQWNSLTGILGISSNIIYEVLAIYFPSFREHEYGTVLGIAMVIMGVMYALLMVGRYSFFEKVLVLFVSIMALSFLLSLVLVYPLPADVLRGLLPSIPRVEGGRMLVAAFVGTTMAAATFLSRPLFIRGKGWTLENRVQQRNDAIVAAVLVFIISGSIMAVAAGGLYREGLVVTKVLDMGQTLEPIAGKFALTLFFFGTFSAGLSSIFPCLMIAPMLIADYQSGELDVNSRQFRVITAIASLYALVVPIFGANPINAQLLTQVFNVFVLPLVIAGMLVLINRSSLMGSYRAGTPLNVGLVLALFFSLVISYNGVLAIVGS